METLTACQSQIAKDTIKGLSSYPKYLLPKYFYDDAGSEIFQDIMTMPEYYLTKCEQEIFIDHKEEMSSAFLTGTQGNFELIELGSGDGVKTKVLLKHLLKKDFAFRYLPVDISEEANNRLVNSLAQELPGLIVNAQNGDYFSVLKQLNGFSGRRKIVLFLGSNIGNFSGEEIGQFLNQLSGFMQKGDHLLIGFDLKKSPETIVRAYSDPHGHTRRFNINHLLRLNRELLADFNPQHFEHHAVYNPISGTAKSYLISNVSQEVYFEALDQSFRFEKWEPVFMEVSQKFDLQTIRKLAINFGFEIVKNFSDKNYYFVDSLWQKK